MRHVARLLAAMVLVGGAGTATPAAPPATPPSVVCQEASRNKLYGTRKIGLDYYFVGR